MTKDLCLGHAEGWGEGGSRVVTPYSALYGGVVQRDTFFMHTVQRFI